VAGAAVQAAARGPRAVCDDTPSASRHILASAHARTETTPQALVPEREVNAAAVETPVQLEASCERESLEGRPNLSTEAFYLEDPE
jgi:hypothetical protein